MYYSDIIVAEASPTIVAGAKGITLGYKYKLYLKDNSKVVLKFYKFLKRFQCFSKLLKDKNHKIFFGICEDYKNKKHHYEKWCFLSVNLIDKPLDLFWTCFVLI